MTKKEDYEDRVCQYSGLLSVEQYEWIEDNSEQEED